MTILLVTMHVIACIFLISIVLVQGGKGAEMGAAFGGSSQTLFGSRGASTFLTKLTTTAAIVFMITSLTLSMVANRRASVIKEGPSAPMGRTIPQQIPQPQMPQQPAQQPTNK